jgi:LysM repeat protein
MSKIINEELSRMFYLLDHKRGVVVSEQVTPATAAPATAAPATAAPATAAPATAAPATAAPATAAPATTQEYVVQKGDTLGKIGQKFGVQWKEIATLNQIKNVNLIRVGQKLKIPGKTQTNAAVQTKTTTVPTDIVSAYGPNVESIINQLFTKMPSFKTFGKYVDKVGMSKGIDMTGIGTNLTVAEIMQKYPTMLVDMPTTGFKFYPATEGRPFTKENYNVLTDVGRVYVQYLNDVITSPSEYKSNAANATNPTNGTTSEPTGTVTDDEVGNEIKNVVKNKKADRRICRIIRKDIKNNTQMSSVLGDVCQVLELCKAGGFIEKSVTLEACKKETTTGDGGGEQDVVGPKIPIRTESVVRTHTLY